MYNEYFGLKQSPFSIAPDPDYLYMSEGHREALAHLVYGLKNDGGFVLLTGEVGTGKTTICRCLLDQIPENTETAFVINPKMTAEELLATICDDFGIAYPGGNTSVKIFVDAINKYLLESHSKGLDTVLIIEEAQNLSIDVLEQLRLLTNLETNQRKLLKIILIGQPELRDKLAKRELRQLAQRITARYHLGPLSKKEVAAYVNHRLSIAGTQLKLFPDSVINKIYSLSGGIPRLINLLCDRALLGAYAQGKSRVDKKTLIQAAREVSGDNRFLSKFSKSFRWVAAGLMSATVGLFLFANFYNNQSFAVKKSDQAPQMPVSISAGPSVDNLLVDTRQIQVEQSGSESREMAFRSLFERWRLPYRSDGTDPCIQALELGFHCVNKQGDMDELNRLNKPAVLKMYNAQGNEFYTMLSSRKGQAATLIVGPANKNVDIKLPGFQWSGEYTLLFQAPPKIRGSIRPGNSGQSVLWLERQMAIIQGRDPQMNKSAIYNNDLLKQVKEFQTAEALNPDGIVGPLTMLRIGTIVSRKEPVLDQQEGDR